MFSLSAPRRAGMCAGSVPEWAVLVGIIALITFLYLVLTTVLPMEKTYQGN